jgi:hypothetical protein
MNRDDSVTGYPANTMMGVALPLIHFVWTADFPVTGFRGPPRRRDSKES